MRKRVWHGCLLLALAGSAGGVLGQETPPGGAERPLSYADLRELPAHVSRLLVLGSSSEGSGALLRPLGGSGVRVSDLPPPGRVPVLYFAFDADRPLKEQMQRALKTVAGWGDKKDLVLTVHRCAGAGAEAQPEPSAQKRAAVVARALRSRGFKTEVREGDQSTYCLVLPRRAREPRNPVGVTVERLP